MSPKLFLSCALAASLPIAASSGLRAQAPTPESPAQFSGPAQLTDVQTSTPQGYLDPNFGARNSKPHPGAPTSDGITPPAAQAQTSQTPQWYKDSPQNYDHAPAKPRHIPAPAKQIQVFDDTEPAPQQELAQEEPPQQEAPPAYDDQRIQPVPRYYGQPDQQAYAPQPQQNYSYAQPQDNGAPQDYPQDDYGPAPDQPGQIIQQPLGAEQLEQLVAPIALYPDQLVAQILTASTYPAQITAADQWVRSMNGAPPEQIAQGASAQAAWDPSIKALTAFPQVLSMLDGNLQWTAALGNAYYNQPQDVLETIQVLRQRAQQSGNLQSTPQAQVIEGQGDIQIQPANPQYIYVPSYNPWYAYGAPIAPYPAFEFGNWGLYIGGGIEWGLGFAVDAFLRAPFAIAAWGCDWLGGAILFNHGFYWTHSHEMHDWGYAHGGRHWDGRGGWGRGGYGGREYARGGYGGRDYARFGNYNHQPMNIHGGGPMAHSGAHSFYGGRGQEGYGRGFEGGSRPQAPGQRAFGGAQPFRSYGGQNYAGRPPASAGPQHFGGGSMPTVRPQQPYGGRQQFAQAPRPSSGFGGGYPRPGQGYMGSPSQLNTWRSPQQNYNQHAFGGNQRAFGGSSGGWGGQPYGRPQSGGHSFFGGGHSAPNYGGGSHSFGGGGSHSFFGGGGHSFGGGSHSFGGGGHSFGGGGHSFGGGGHSFGGGGGHSFGGGHSGGGHHR